MKQAVLSLLIVLIVLQAVYAEKVSPGKYLLLNATLYSGEKREVENKTLYVYINSDLDVNLQYNGSSYFLNKYQCKTNMPYRVCLQNVSFDEQDNKIAVTELYFMTADIAVERVITEHEAIPLGAIQTITVTLLNNGSLPANDILYTDIFPENIGIASVTNAERLGNVIQWKGSLAPGNSREIEYEIYGKNASVQTLVANITYHDGNTTIVDNSSELELEFVNDFFSATLLNDSLETYEQSEINISLENLTTDFSSVLNIAFPDSFIVSAPSGFSKSGNVFSIDVEQSTGDEFTFSFYGTRTGNYSLIIVSASPKMESYFIDSLMLNESIEIAHQSLILATNYADGDEVKENTEKQIVLELTNPNAFTDFVNARLVVLLGNQTIKDEKIENLIKGKATSLSFTTTVPETELEESRVLNITVHYENDDKQKFFSEELVSLTLVPDDGIEIIKTFSNVTVYPNQTLNVTVSIKNNRGFDLEKVVVTDAYPVAFEFLQGLYAKGVALDAAETLEVYSYLLKVPDIEYDTDYVFETSAVNEFAGIAAGYSVQSTVHVLGPLGVNPDDERGEDSVNVSSNESTFGNNQSQLQNITQNASENNKAYKEELVKNDEGEEMTTLMLVLFMVIILMLFVLMYFNMKMMKAILPQQPKQQPVQQPVQPQQTQQQK
ncbi:hypothetical protein C4573_06830 [Candidatus Woesearchaeota archaeon]|nr:MAG: hypothetical protein C4573_06830 [Candidatus Woesearchaeota archaeon]